MLPRTAQGWARAALVIGLLGCEPPPLDEVAPYCALARPCVADVDCPTRHGRALPTCDNGRCVTEYLCRTDADCAGGRSCRFLFPRGGIGPFSCVRPCALDAECAPEEFCNVNEACVPRYDDCRRDGCEDPGTHCVPWERGIYGCIRACGADADCSPFDTQLCVAGSCFAVECVEAYDCGAGNIVCRNARVFE